MKIQLPILSYAICYLLQNGHKSSTVFCTPVAVNGTCLPLTHCWPRALPKYVLQCLSFAGMAACCRDLGKGGKCGLSPPPMSLKLIAEAQNNEQKKVSPLVSGFFGSFLGRHTPPKNKMEASEPCLDREGIVLSEKVAPPVGFFQTKCAKIPVISPVTD